MTIHIEICKACNQKDKWNMRVGDLEGCTEVSNFTKKEILEEINAQFEIEEDLKKNGN